MENKFQTVDISLYTLTDKNGNFIGVEKTERRAFNKAAQVGAFAVTKHRYAVDVVVPQPQPSCEQKLKEKQAQLDTLRQVLSSLSSSLN